MSSFWQKHKTDVIALALMVGTICVMFSIRGYLNEQQNRIRMEEELKATKQLLAYRNTEIQSINRTMEERDKKTSDLVKQIQELRNRPIPVKEIIKEIPKYIPITEPATLPNPDKPESPSAVLDPTQLAGIRDYYLDCQAKTLKLQSCEENATDWKKKEVSWNEKEKILEQQRDAAIRAYKGGTIWQRAWRGAKTFGVGFALGAATGATIKK